MGGTSKEILNRAAAILKQAGLPAPGAEAMALIRELAGIDAAQYYASNPRLSEDTARIVLKAAERRALGEPIQYITGRVEFMDMDIRVGPGVLVPRPETEMLVAEFFHRRPEADSPLAILDLCTGSGCIALALARHYPQARVLGVDKSADALQYAHHNARALGISNARFIRGSLYRPVGDALFHAIVSNPPYIPSAEIQGLMPEVSVYEPHEALDGGPDGLEFYREIIQGAPARLRPGGLLMLELGVQQAAEVAVMAEAHGLSVAARLKDPAGHQRIIVMEKPGEVNPPQDD